MVDSRTLKFERTSLHSFEHVFHRLIENLPAAKEKHLRFQLDGSDVDLVCPSDVEVTLERMLSLAAARTPLGGEIDVTIVNSPKTIEIEVADSGQDEPRPALAVLSQIDAPGRRVKCQPCPQGGMAITLVLDRLQSVRQVA